MDWLKSFTPTEIIAMVFVAGGYVSTVRALSKRVGEHDVIIAQHDKKIERLDERTKEL